MPIHLLNPLWPTAAPSGAGSCGDCVWRRHGQDGSSELLCRRHRDAPVQPDWPPCAAWAGALDCLTCGACCREAYHSVEVEPDDPFLGLHPELVELVEQRPTVARMGPRCAALHGEPGQWACAVYKTRPATCRDFEMGGENCVIARRRVGLTP